MFAGIRLRSRNNRILFEMFLKILGWHNLCLV
jgi:hypothetical protein